MHDREIMSSRGLLISMMAATIHYIPGFYSIDESRNFGVHSSRVQRCVNKRAEEPAELVLYSTLDLTPSYLLQQLATFLAPARKSKTSQTDHNKHHGARLRNRGC